MHERHRSHLHLVALHTLTQTSCHLPIYRARTSRARTPNPANHKRPSLALLSATPSDARRRSKASKQARAARAAAEPPLLLQARMGGNSPQTPLRGRPENETFSSRHPLRASREAHPPSYSYLIRRTLCPAHPTSDIKSAEPITASHPASHPTSQHQTTPSA